jgi:excisionase family DNA binding protein
MQPDEELIGAVDAARVLGVTSSAVRRWIRAGRVPARKLPGPVGAYLIRRGDLDALIALGDDRRAS